MKTNRTKFKKVKEKFLDPPPDHDPYKNVMDSSLTFTAPLQQVVW